MLLFLKLVVRGFLWVRRFPPLLHQLMVSANEIKLRKMSNLIAELSFHTTWHMTWYMWLVPDMLHVIHTWIDIDSTLATWAYVLETVGSELSNFTKLELCLSVSFLLVLLSELLLLPLLLLSLLSYQSFKAYDYKVVKKWRMKTKKKNATEEAYTTPKPTLLLWA